MLGPPPGLSRTLGVAQEWRGASIYYATFGDSKGSAPAAGRGRENEAGRGAGGRQARERQRERGVAALTEEEDDDAGDARRGEGAQEDDVCAIQCLLDKEGKKCGKSCCAATASSR